MRLLTPWADFGGLLAWPEMPGMLAGEAWRLEPCEAGLQAPLEPAQVSPAELLAFLEGAD